MLRDDLSHPFLAGNKWRKLKYTIQDFENSDKKAILTFGGKYSNHLVACAAAGKMMKIPMIGILRGEEKVSNANLVFLQQCGMKLLSVSRVEYRLRDDPEYLQKLFEKCVQEFPDILSGTDDIFLVPEGGSSDAGVKGCMEIMNDVPSSASHICVACGTGTTLAGISMNTREDQKAIGISVLKGENFLMKSVLKHGAPAERTQIIFDYHFGGYARSSVELQRFCIDFARQTGIAIESVYTGKLFFAIMDLISKKYFPQGSHIVLIHTGGIFDFNRALEI